MQLTLAEDSTFNRRYRVQLADGGAVEAVLYRGDTLCVSSQVGCAVGCPFCASGAQGLKRPLQFEELVEQVEQVRASHGALKRVTVSGVGEPLHNAEALGHFLLWCRDARLGMSLTTSGGTPSQLRRWLGLPHNGLTLSVHAGTEPTRARLVPRAPRLQQLYEVLEEQVPLLSRKRRKKLALAYLLMAEANDSDAELQAFADRAAPLGLAVHLYAYNPVPTSAQQPVTRQAYERAYDRLRGAGLLVRMSSKARLEANGGCGTLVARRDD